MLLSSLLVPLIVLFTVYNNVYTASEVYFSGKSFLRYVPSKSIFEKDNVNRIELHFKTIHPTGLIVLMIGQYDDSMEMRLIQGKLSFRITRSYRLNPDFAEILTGNNLNDDKWHHIKILRTGRLNEVILDNEPKTLLSPSTYNMLSFSQVFFIGGYDNFNLRNIKHLSSGTRFIGCLKIVEIDNRDPVLYFKKGNTRVHIIPDGMLMFGCPVSKSSPIEFTKPASRVEIILDKNNTLPVLSFSMSIRTLSNNGNILLGYGKTTSLQLHIKGRQLALDLIQNSKKQVISGVVSEVIISDGLWHVITVIVSETDLFLEVNGVARSSQSIAQASSSCTAPSNVMLGGTSYEGNGFVGCLNKLKHNENEISFSQPNVILKNGARHGCNLRDLCYPNPCLNNGRCMQNWKDYSCDCSSTNYYGKQCEVSIYRSSCAAYQKMGLTETSYCLIDSDGPGNLKPFTSLCRFDENQQAYTTVHHSKEIEFASGSGKIKFQKYIFHTLKYDMEISKLATLIQKSKSCRQKVKFRCFNAILLNAPNGPANVGWRSRSNELKSYWGGVPSNGFGCACGINKTCIRTDKLCNCDYKNNKWAEDAGYITDKTSLPIIRLDVTEITDGYGYFTIGPLECFGDNTLEKENFSNPRDRVIPKDVLSQVCMSIQAKNNLVDIANSTKRGIIQSESEPILTTQNTNDFKTNESFDIDISPIPVSDDDAVADGLTILEITLICVAALAVLILIIKFFICTLCNRLNGQVLLNHDLNSDHEHDLKHSNGGNYLYNSHEEKPKRKGILSAYWV